MRHLIRVLTVCKNNHLGVSHIQRVNIWKVISYKKKIYTFYNFLSLHQFFHSKYKIHFDIELESVHKS